MDEFQECFDDGCYCGTKEERARILAIIENEPWEVYADNYYQTYDPQASIAKLKSLIERIQ